MSSTVSREIISQISNSQALANEEGLFIFTALNDKTIIADGKSGVVKIWDGMKTTILEHLPYEEQLGYVHWVIDNAYQLKNLMRDTLNEIMVDPFDENSFSVEPTDVFGKNPETGENDILIGRIGIVEDVLEERKFKRVIFVSMDGSWTTLSGWFVGVEESYNLILDDLKTISDAIIDLTKNLKDV